MSSLKLVELQCEYRNNPLGLDAAKPRLSWKLESGRRGVLQTAYQIQVSREEDAFDSPLWDSGKVESDQSVLVEYAGEPLLPRQRYYCRVRAWDNQGGDSGWSKPQYWETGLMGTGAWQADWITLHTGYSEAQSEPAYYLRKEFQAKGRVASARMYASSLGLYELQLNGGRVGEDYFTPGWTSYKTRIQYQTYDVTELLRSGDNALGIVLADGWYRGNLCWEKSRNLFGVERAAIAQLHIRYESGEEEIVTTDASWQGSYGPIRMSEIYHGETYDALMEVAGWSSPGFAGASWRPVDRIEHSKDVLIAQENLPVRKIQELKPKELIKTPAKETVLDMGQNMVGWVRFRVKGKPGDRVVLKHAELLDQQGNFYTDNLRSARQTVEYICRGEGEEEFEPQFSFQGFRYVKLESYPGEPDLNDFTGVVLHTELETTGSFECSDPLVNQLYANIVWGQKGNFLDVPTDCPQRDERLGWTGDAQVFIRASSFNMNVAPFFAKWLKDLKADQRDDGAVPHVVPHALKDNHFASAAWGDASVICPWTVYLCYGDRRVLEDQYESMKAWIAFIRADGDNELLWNTGFHFGDWLALEPGAKGHTGVTPKDLIATAFYAYCSRLLADAADVLGRTEDARTYRDLSERVAGAFREEFMSASGRMISPTQTAYLLPLMFGLAKEEQVPRLVQELVKLIEDNGGHLRTGFVGTPYLCHVLSKHGHHELAVRLLLRREYPSWLYPVTKGATTVWEHWDGIKPDGSFRDKSMNSYNHYAYGAIADWMFQRLAGINSEWAKPGYKHVRLQPQPSRQLGYVKAAYQSVYGEIRSGWSFSEEEQLRVEVAVPANTTAALTLPRAVAGELRINGQPAASGSSSILPVQEADGVTLEIGSGEYVFEYKWREVE